MSGLIGTQPQPMAWQDIFKNRAGFSPESAGVKTAADADKFLRTLDAMRQPINLPPIDATKVDFGKAGMRNEAIYPTK